VAFWRQKHQKSPAQRFFKRWRHEESPAEVRAEHARAEVTKEEAPKEFDQEIRRERRSGGPVIFSPLTFLRERRRASGSSDDAD
jgi:hypothetical protein